MNALHAQKCTACREDSTPLTSQQIAELLKQLTCWELIQKGREKRLQRVFRFENFAAALAFTNLVGALAEENNHHPTLLTEWGCVTVTWWTHKIGGLHMNDFILASLTDRLGREPS